MKSEQPSDLHRFHTADSPVQKRRIGVRNVTRFEQGTAEWPMRGRDGQRGWNVPQESAEI